MALHSLRRPTTKLMRSSPSFAFLLLQRGLSSASLPRKSANTLLSDAELKNRVDRWTLPYTPGPLTPAEFNQFWNDGFVIKYNLLSNSELDPAQKDLEELVDVIANRLFNAGRIKDKCEKLGFFERLTAIEKQFPSASVLIHNFGVVHPGIQKLWSNKKLLDIAQQILGPDIAGHPVWNVRSKTPQQEQATVPWHQDAAYLDEKCWTTLQLTAWVPLLDTNTKNGCMQLLRGGHQRGQVCKHTCCVGGTWYIDLAVEEMERTLEIPVQQNTVTCEVPKGAVLFLNNLIPHRSLENYSDQIRWSFDLRWQRPSEPHGFEGIKDAILMRKKGDPTFVIDWATWANNSRAQKQRDVLSQPTKDIVDQVKEEEKVVDPFDTTIAGPWMERWELINHNRHTAALQKKDGTGQVKR